MFGDPNVDMLVQSKGFPFFLPGNVGPAWQNKYTTVQNEKITMKYIPQVKIIVCINISYPFLLNTFWLFRFNIKFY